MLTHNQLRITRKDVVLTRLPAAFDGLRIVQVSDLHFYRYSPPEFFSRVVKEVNALAADVLVMTGDVIHYGNDHLDLAARYLEPMTAALGKFGIIGNHDYCDGARSAHVEKMLVDSGFSVLRNANTALERSGERLWFAGIDDLWHGAPDLWQTLARIPIETEPVVLLAHNPLMFDPARYYPHGMVDLTISGHTHAGHVYLPFLGPVYRYMLSHKYRYGLYEKDGRQLYVTSGVGSAAFYFKIGKNGLCLPPFRFNTHPEIAVLTLRRKAG